MPSLAELMECHCVAPMESTIPSNVTLADWRRTRPRIDTRRGPRRRRVRGRLR
jgi:hypothetical protein